MNVKQFKAHLGKEGLSMELEVLKQYLKTEFDIEEVPQNMVADITNDLKAKYATALEKVEKGEGSLIGIEKPAAPAPQAPTQQQEVIDIDPQVQEAIAAGASGLQTEVIDYIDQNEQQLASITSMLVQYNRGLKVRLWTGVAEGIQSGPDLGLDINATVKQRWDTLNQNLRSKIDQVNAMAGVSRDAAA